MKTAFFVDFDGTISKRDVGYNMFHHFSNGKNDELIPDWKAKKISSRECLTKEAEMISPTTEEFYSYLDTFEIDPTFKEFVSVVRKNEMDIKIVSDGLDLYINYLLSKNRINSIPVISNIGKLENKKLIIEFPNDNKECDYCGNCKGERIKEFRAKHDEKYRIIFVGDGYSDACATKEADLLFAKKDLEHYCIDNRIKYQKYNNFNDVLNNLKIKRILK